MYSNQPQPAKTSGPSHATKMTLTSPNMEWLIVSWISRIVAMDPINAFGLGYEEFGICNVL